MERLDVQMPLQSAKALQEKLAMDERSYQFVAGYSMADARAYFVYGALDEVIKSAIGIIRWNEFLTGRDEEESEEAQEDGEHLNRLIWESVSNEQAVWIRKLTEILCDLICFSETNQQEKYRTFLAAAQLDAYLSLQQDFRDFFSCVNANVKTTIRTCVQIIRQSQ